MFKQPLGMKKSLGLLLAASALTLGACGQDANTNQGGTQGGSEESGVEAGRVNFIEDFQVGSTFVAETPMELSLLYRELAESPWQDDWWFIEALKEKTGVDLGSNTTHVLNDDLAQQRQLLISAGNAPELMPFIWAQDVPQFVDGGSLLPLNDYLQYMPHFNHFLQEWDLEEEFENTRQADGNFYLLPGIKEDITLRFTVALRYDILRELGLEIPTTWDEIQDVLEAVAAAYPGTVPYQEAWGWDATSNVSAGAFGVRFGWGLGDGLVLNHDTNSYQHISQMPELREFTEYWRGLVEEGLLLDESLTGSFGGEAWERLLNGHSFMAGATGSMPIGWNQDVLELVEQGTPEGPFGIEGAQFVAVPVPNGPSGTISETRIDNGIVLNRSIAQRDDFLAILQFVDWLWYSEEGREFAMWGIEGETFEWVDTDEGPRRQLLDGFSEPTWSFGGNVEQASTAQQLQRDLGLNQNVFVLTEGGSRELITSVMDGPNTEVHLLNAQSNLAPANPSAPFNTEEREIAGNIANNVTDMTNAAVREFIVGTRELNDENWNAFVEATRAAGADRLEEMATEALRRQGE